MARRVLPAGLPHRRELEYASRALTSIEINGTYYSTFEPDSWQKWAAETPDGFTFAIKGSRYCTNRRVLSDALSAKSIARFIEQGLQHLGDKLGPINWQFMTTKKFDAEDFAGFLKLLPGEIAGRQLRHAVENSAMTASAIRASTRWREGGVSPSSMPRRRRSPRSTRQPPTSPMRG